MKVHPNLVWIDLEMTGLDLERERIIEIATIVTDSNLNVLSEGPVLAISQGQVFLDEMDEWNQTHHSRSGLLDRIEKEGVGEREAEAMTLSFINEFVSQGEAPLCGNSVCQDRRFLNRYMPTLESFFALPKYRCEFDKRVVEKMETGSTRSDQEEGFSQRAS